VNVLLDTCVLSEVWKREPDPGVLEWFELQAEQSLFLSSLTIGELTRGVMRMPAGSRRDRLRAWVREALPARFAGRILSIDGDIAARWGVMLAEAERRGEVLPVIDSLIAATAAFHDFTVATRNEHDFRRCSVPVINPWKRIDR
jgi:predicted nucleic acid-binding protein